MGYIYNHNDSDITYHRLFFFLFINMPSSSSVVITDDATKRDEARSLEKITDYIEEIQGRKSVDTKVIEQKLKELKAKKVAANKAKADRERELMKVKINKDDVEVLIREFDCCPKITETSASMILREQGGDLKKALEYIIHQQQ